MMDSKKTILLLMTNTICAERRSGIHRVAVELAKHLPDVCNLEIVKWDSQDGQLRLADMSDLDQIFGEDEWPDRITVRPEAHRVKYRFGDMFTQNSNVWVLNPEISYHSADGSESLAKIISQCRYYGFQFASIFYDLIPITNTAYKDYATRHARYVCELIRSDVILPISEYSKDELVRYYHECGVSDPRSRVDAVLLPELQSAPPPTTDPADPPIQARDRIVMVGTVEPRKGQVEFLRAFAQAADRSPEVRQLSVVIAGSLHPDVATAFRRLVNANPAVRYLDYASEDIIAAEYQRALFSVFASVDEGYGLPIAESLAHGVPCLCANFGSMAEIAKNGGCLTTDMTDIDAVTESLIRMASDADLLQTLRGDIARRAFRTWSDYAEDIVSRLVAPDIDAPPPSALAWEDRTRTASAGTVSDGDMSAWLEADIVGFTSTEARDAFIHETEIRQCDALLPTELVIAPDPHLADRLNQAKARMEADRVRARRFADADADYSATIRNRAEHIEPRRRFLRIIISTYNRAPFVAENVRWLLSKVTPLDRDIQVVVVDNASTDDTMDRLARHVGNPGFHLMRNTANTGMLGNLKVCSTLSGAEYTWVIGDDDFIVPDQVASIMAALEAHRGTPIACVNFGVYHRAVFSQLDNADMFLNERILLAPNPDASGLLSIPRMASQHDNLFTAIYPIIWRSDTLAACFNYPFDNTPFVNLTESVPTTKFILEMLRYSEGYWHSPVGIVGNAHNSWSHHRPRWHAVLMPLVFELAKTAGLDSRQLKTWSNVHLGLFEEAVQISKETGAPVNICAEDLEVSWRVFRKRLTLPQGVDQ